jgi:sulfoxide reductase heme-binding subunit YedZ
VGWRLVYYTAVGIALACLASYAFHGAGANGIHHLLRLTARLALVLFSLTFSARALAELFDLTWFVANRRYLGVSFAVAHGFHLMAILALANLEGFSAFVARQGVTLWFGALGYLLVAAMVATSFDVTTEWLGRRRWRILHGIGVYGLATFFAFTYLAGAVKLGGDYLLLAAIALGAPALRVVAWARRGRGRGRVRGRAEG